MNCKNINYIQLTSIILVILLIIYVIRNPNTLNIFKIKEGLESSSNQQLGDYILGTRSDSSTPSGSAKLTIAEAEQAASFFGTYGVSVGTRRPSGASIRLFDNNPPEDRRSYSSIFGNDEIGTGHATSRLNSVQGWSSAKNEIGEWMMIDLSRPIYIFGVVNQARAPGDFPSQNVTKLKILTSNNASGPFTDAGTYLADTLNGTRTFTIYLKTPVKARYVKLEPQAWKNHMSMRAAVLTVHSINYNTNATGFNNGIYLPIGKSATEEEIKAQESGEDYSEDASSSTVSASNDIMQDDNMNNYGSYYSTGKGDKNNNLQKVKLSQDYEFNL